MADTANKLQTITVPIHDKWGKDPFPDSYTCMVDANMGEAWKRGDDGAIWVNQTTGQCYNPVDGPKTEWYRVPYSEKILDEEVGKTDWLEVPL
ncbi:hypothetical protein ACFVYJ_06230 [Pontibacter sp. JAM-7]|uniref:hypothetical protein n=1 Tax=Pontibacter sp. JAM-7 TaxID=3366581 RepID=UPI003AF59115